MADDWFVVFRVSTSNLMHTQSIQLDFKYYGSYANINTLVD